MASTIRQKESLRAAVMAYLAGAHCVTEEVNRMQTLVFSDDEESEELAEMKELLIENYNHFLRGNDYLDLYIEILNDEDLYPFGTEWKSDFLLNLVKATRPLSLAFESGEDEDDPSRLVFKFKKGYLKLLNELSSSLKTNRKPTKSVDHWLSQLLNTAFFAGMNIAAQVAENSHAYYEAIEEMENEEEPWGKYPQLVECFERQLRRETKRSTGLVTSYDE